MDTPGCAPFTRGDTLLTTRQRQVLDLNANGLSSPAIAEQLAVSPETVPTHIKHLLR
jgi:DNA-binding NarL/FixJ family response regulator